MLIKNTYVRKNITILREISYGWGKRHSIWIILILQSYKEKKTRHNEWRDTCKSNWIFRTTINNNRNKLDILQAIRHNWPQLLGHIHCAQPSFGIWARYKTHGDFWVKIDNAQWLKSGEWDYFLVTGPKLALGQQKNW